MFSINSQENRTRSLLGLALATIVLTTLVVRPVHSVTQQHAASALDPQGLTKRRRVQSMTRRQLARVGQNDKATNYSTQPQTPALKASGKIAFNRYTGTVTQMFTMNSDGSDVKQITDNAYYNLDPAWSPDGAKIAFDTVRENGESEIYLMNADGSNQAGLSPPAFGIDPEWSPDGKKIAYWQDFVGIIFVMDADGSNQKALTDGAAFDLEPSWSPDGSKIVFSSYRDGQTEIYVMNADGSNQTRFTNDVVNYDEEPVWSPDGSRIAFTKYLGCSDFGFGVFCEGAQIMLMQADGSNPTYLTGGNDVLWSSFATWSPDSAQLAFEAYLVGEVYSIRADGSGLVDLTNNDADDFFPSWGPSLSPPGPNTVQFSSASYTVSEGSPRVDITLSRTGDTTSSAAVSCATNDSVGLNNCDIVNGVASPRCDYINTSRTVQFAAGETSKAFSIAIVDDSYAEGSETFAVSLNSPSGTTLGTQSTATVTITDNDSSNGTNPIDSTDFFVRQQYIDFLGREPDPLGFAGWTATINNCAPGDTNCDRIHVSQQFFQSAEFQDRGYFVYRFYPVAFERKPDYSEFVPDLASVSGFLDANQLEAAKVQFIADFMARPAFVSQYNSLSNTAYVDALINTAAVNLPNRQTLIDSLNNNTATRAQILRQIVESSEVSAKYNHQAFAVMEYFGYLRRQPDALYLDWITVLDSTNDPRGMVTGFVTSAEYRQRFGP